MKWNELHEAEGYESPDMNAITEKYRSVLHNYVKARGKYPIYRGMKDTGVFILGNGKNVSRKSANTHNFYTLITDIDPAWNAFPERSKSFICSTYRASASGYGSVYVVIPLEGQNIGVCPRGDFWDSFGDKVYPNEINGAIDEMSYHAGININPNSPTIFKEQLAKIDEAYSKDKNLRIPNNIEKIGYTRGSSLYEVYANYLNPERNKFAITTDVSSIPEYREVWMSGKVLFIDEEVYLKTIVPMFSKPVSEDLIEGVNDKHIFKAIFTAGGPGSGKTTVSKKILSHLGFKEVNVDKFIEFIGKKNDLDLKDMDNWDRGVKSKAHGLNKTQLDLYIDGRLPLIIDGTGRNYDKIVSLSNDLKKMGYETGLLFVNTDLETAQERNNKRERSVAPDVVETIWKQTQANLGRFQNYFGNNMFIVDSSSSVDVGGVTKRINSFINEPVKSPIAKKWMSNQKPITELLDTTAEIDLIPGKRKELGGGTVSHSEGTFNVGNTDYFIRFTPAKRYIEVDFGYVNPPTNDTSSQFIPSKLVKENAMKVISIVKNRIKKYIIDNNPNVLFFAGDTTTGNAKLYSFMGKMLTREIEDLGYTFSENNLPRSVFFRLTKNQETDVNESLDSSEEVETVKNTEDHIRIGFTSNDTKYMVSFERIRTADDIWEVKYGTWNDAGMNTVPTGTNTTKETFKVLASVVKSIMMFIERKSPNKIVFNGHKTSKLSAVYSLMVAKFKSKLEEIGYDIGKEDGEYADTFSISKKSTITETASSGATSAGNVATANGTVGGLGVGFDPNGDWGIYEFAKKRQRRSK